MSSLYLVFMLVMITAWIRIPSTNSSIKKQPALSVSVIIPVRNESKNIAKLLRQLMSQSYPKELFEIIVVNDHSTDNTSAIIEQLKIEEGINLRLMNLKKLKEGKKAALTEGITAANGEIILTTDGDCEVSKEWIQTIINSFDEHTQMAFGLVAILDKNFFSKLQMIDFAALIGIGAASWRLGTAGMCNGANLAFRKLVFQECGGYEGSEKHPSGDDEFLLRKVSEQYPQGIQFIKSRLAVVFTGAQPNLQTFIQQRIRWAGKWKLHKDITTKLVAIFVFLFYSSLLIGTGISFFSSQYLSIILAIWGVKWLLDVVLVKAVLNIGNQRLPLIESIVLSMLYPFYAIGIGISTINYTFEWKGRKY